MNNRKLSLLVVILALIAWGISKLTSSDTTQSFKTDLIRIDTAQVTHIKIDLQGATESAITLQRNNSFQWLATKGTVTAVANRGEVDSILNNIHLIKTQRVAAKKKEKWATYQVDEKSGTSIKVYAGSKLLEDFIVGKFSFNEKTSEASSFVRISGGEEVYAIDGFLSDNIRQGFDTYRNNTILNIVTEELTSLVLTNEAGVVDSFINWNNQWTNDSTVIDSIAIANYLSGIQNVRGNKFVDDIDPTTYSIPMYRTLVISGNNMSQPTSVICYRDEAKTPPYIIHSSENTASYFSSEEADLFQKIFGALERL